MENSLYKHNNGNLYRVLFLTNVESSNAAYEIHVIYETVSNGNRWSRPLNSWDRSFTKVEICENEEAHVSGGRTCFQCSADTQDPLCLQGSCNTYFFCSQECMDCFGENIGFDSNGVRSY